MILVTGATGMFGSRVTRESVARGARVRGLVHSAARAGDLEALGAEAVVADLDNPPSLRPALEGVERVFLVTPMDDRIAQRETAVIEAAKQAGASHIVKLHGAVRHGGDPLEREHQAAIDALRRSGLSWTLLSPQTVMETNLLSQSEAVKQTGALWGCAGEGRVGIVAADDCGRAGAILLTSDGHEGREYRITGPEALTFGQIAEHMSRVLGRQIAYNDLPEEDFKGLLMQQGLGEQEVEFGVLLHFRAFRRGDAELVTEDYRELTGRDPTTLDAWLAEHAGAFA